jgi:hypothetical protein
LTPLARGRRGFGGGWWLGRDWLRRFLIHLVSCTFRHSLAESADSKKATIRNNDVCSSAPGLA